MIIRYNKLIRDKVPEQARKKGNKISIHQASTDQEYEYLLKTKLQEEITELAEGITPERIIDILDVLDTLIEFKKYDKKELQAIRENIEIEQGKFSKRLVLESSQKEIGHDQNYLI
jgi:predicted house-cleaning noncanonical NTP pyrophosphatase (MazG superfamily)